MTRPPQTDDRPLGALPERAQERAPDAGSPGEGVVTKTYAMPRVVVKYRDTHMTTRELAAMCVVGENVITKACKNGRLSAIKIGRQWLIPRAQAGLFADAYVKYNSGESWEPKVERTPRAFRPTSPTKHQVVQLEVPGHLLRLIDAERERRYRETGKRKGNMRSNIIFEAIERMLGDQPITDAMSRLEAMG